MICNCCGECEIGTDPFDTDLSQFTTTGSPSVSGGKLEMTAGDVAIFTPEAAGGASDPIVVVTTPMATDGDPATFRVRVAYVDSDNYAFAEFSITGSGGTLQFGKRIGGSDTYVSDEIDLPADADEADERFSARVCWRPGDPGGEPGEPALLTVYATISPDANSWNNIANSYGEPDGSEADQGATTFSESWFFSGLLSLPPSADIDGVAVGITARGTENSGMFRPTLEQAQLLYDGGTFGDPRLSGDELELTLTLEGFGSDTDDWGTTLTTEELRDPTFGVQFSFVTDSNTVYVDAIGLDVYYTPLSLPVSGILSVKIGNWVAAATVEAPAGAKAGLSVSAGDWDFEDFTLKYHKASPDYASCPECLPTDPSCSPEETEDECSGAGRGFAVHDEPFGGGGDSVNIADGGNGAGTGQGVYAWCFDWSPGLRENGYISFKATIAYTGAIATVGINFGWDTVAIHPGCGELGDDEVPGGNCPGLNLYARPQAAGGEGDEGYGYYISNNPLDGGEIAVMPSSGDELEIRITCEEGGLVARYYINDSLEVTASGIALPNPLNYRVANTLSDVDAASSATWSDIKFVYVSGDA